MPAETPRDGMDARTTTAAPRRRMRRPFPSGRRRRPSCPSKSASPRAARGGQGTAPQRLAGATRRHGRRTARALGRTTGAGAQDPPPECPGRDHRLAARAPPGDRRAPAARPYRPQRSPRPDRRGGPGAARRAEAALAERQGYLDQIARHGDELAAIRRERELTRQALADAFSDEARAGLTSIAKEIERIEKACVAALATEEWSLARLERRPEVAALLARRGREEEQMAETDGSRRCHPAAPGRATATVLPVAVSRTDDPRLTASILPTSSPNDPDQPALPEKVGQSPAAVKRTGGPRHGRARPSPAARGRRGRRDRRPGRPRRARPRPRGRAPGGGRPLRRRRGQRPRGRHGRLPLPPPRPGDARAACLRARSRLRRRDTAAAPTYRVVATYGLDGDRFAPGEASRRVLLERAQPRRARS